MLALDAVPPNIIERWCDDGSLPTLSALRRQGRYGKVTSDAARLPVSVWPTFHTGRGAGGHGIYHGVQWDPDSMRLRTVGFRGWAEVGPFWRAHSEAGVPVVALDVPFSIYTGPGSGRAVEVLGWGADAQLWQYSRPHGLLDEMNRRFGRSSQKRDLLGLKPSGWLERQLLDLRADVGKRGRIIEHLLRRFDWRIGVACFSEVHKAGHWYWSARTTGEEHGGLKRVLQEVDREIGKLKQLLRPQDQLAVFSVHGMGPLGDTDRFSEAIWRYLEPAHQDSTRRRLDPVRVLRQVLPTEVLRDLSGRLPKAAYIRAHERYLNAGRNWRRYRTVLLHPELNYYLRANLRGRERDGLLTEAEADRHLDWVVEELRTLVTPGGTQVFESVERLGDEYAGPGRRLLPDVVARPRRQEMGETLRSRSGAFITAPRLFEQDGHHMPDGFYIQAGPGIAAGAGPTVDGKALARFLLAPAGL